MKNFWEKLPKPFFALAPMADVTDAAFRSIISKYGKPDVLWTEFVSADGLACVGRETLKYDLMYSEKERPIVVQLFSAHPDKMREASKLCAKLCFDGIDINMGCPDRTIEKQGAGAAMIKNKESAKAIIQAVKDGISDTGISIPISVKTRVGYNSVKVDEWISFLLKQDIDALIIHARTRKEMSNVPARWEHIKEAVDIRDKIGVKTKIIGNGDVLDISHARKLAKETGCDGVMLGRAIFGNPWLFKEISQIRQNLHTLPASGLLHDSDFVLFVPFIEEKLKVMIEHTKLFEELLGKVKNFAIMKKHYKAYVNGFDGARELRVKLMECSNSSEIENIVDNFLANP